MVPQVVNTAGLVGSTIKKRQRLNEIKEVIKSITPGVVGAASGVVYTRGH